MRHQSATADALQSPVHLGTQPFVVSVMTTLRSGWRSSTPPQIRNLSGRVAQNDASDHMSAVAPGSWVPREFELFRERRPDGTLHAVIGAGSPPHCFPSPLLATNARGNLEAPLAADLRPPREGGADGESKSLVRLIAGLLGVGFDDLWRREERRRRLQRLTRAAEAAAVAATVVGVIGGGACYRSHARVTIDLAPLHRIGSQVRVVATEEVPRENRSTVRSHGVV